MQELISYFYKGIFTHSIFIEFILYFNLITCLVESSSYNTFVGYRTKRVGTLIPIIER